MFRFCSISPFLLLVLLDYTQPVASSLSSSPRRVPFLASADLKNHRRRRNGAFSAVTVGDIRGGSTAVEEEGDEDENTEVPDITEHPEFEDLQSYRLQQQILLQLRATFLSEALARRGLPVPTLVDVATPDGEQPPQEVDWDCALATSEDPKSCLYSFDAEPNTKVVAPLGTTQWISLGALNRLRRTDPTKVEPMWHSQYAVLQSWFDPESDFSLLQHVGVQGFLLNALLQGFRLPIVVGLAMAIGAIVFMPFLEYVANRFLVSGVLWYRWHQWSRFIHAALPLKLFLGQIIGRFLASLFGKLVGLVKDRLVEYECQILEQSIPLTVGVPTPSMDQDDIEEEIGELAIGMTDDEDSDEDSDSDDE